MTVQKKVIRPLLLRYRSSPGFIITTVAFAVFTVSSCNYDTENIVLNAAGCVSLWSNSTYNSFRTPVSHPYHRGQRSLR